MTRPEEVVWTDQIIGFHELREHLVTDALILDVGCGDGGFVYLCQKAGFRAAGMELNRAAADRAASLGIRDISQATLVDYGEFSLDCVVTLHVLEHLADCRNFAAQFARVLRPGGLALVVVPNYGSVRFRVQPLRYWTAPYQHMNGLCSDSLDGLFLSFGFERLSLRARWLRTGRLDIWTALSMSATRVFGNALGFFPTKLVALYRKQLSRQ